MIATFSLKRKNIYRSVCVYVYDKTLDKERVGGWERFKKYKNGVRDGGYKLSGWYLSIHASLRTTTTKPCFTTATYLCTFPIQWSNPARVGRAYSGHSTISLSYLSLSLSFVLSISFSPVYLFSLSFFRTHPNYLSIYHTHTDLCHPPSPPHT